MSTKKHLNFSPELHLVLLHGWGMNSGIFDTLCHQLRCSLADTLSSIRISAIDLPGYGYNKHSDKIYADLPTLALAVEAMLPNNTILIGWSLGGLVAQYLAIKRVQKVVGLITLCSSPKFIKDDNWLGIDPKVLDSFQQQLEHDHLRTLKRFLAIQNLGQVNAKTDVQKMLEAVQRKPIANVRTLKYGLDMLKNTDLRTYISHIDIPFLHLYGRRDALVPYNEPDSTLAINSSSKHKIYSSASHAPFISHPELVIADILAFIK